MRYEIIPFSNQKETENIKIPKTFNFTQFWNFLGKSVNAVVNVIQFWLFLHNLVKFVKRTKPTDSGLTSLFRPFLQFSFPMYITDNLQI